MRELVQSASRLRIDETERAVGLIDETVGSPSTSLTEEHIEQAGGREEIADAITRT